MSTAVLPNGAAPGTDQAPRIGYVGCTNVVNSLNQSDQVEPRHAEHQREADSR